MIRLARETDRPAVAAIWASAFDDPPEYINFFMRNRFDPTGCLLSLDDAGRPAAAVHLLPAEYVDATGASAPVQYLYAAATLPECRRQGRMAGLIERADALGRERGCRFTCLLPASEKLYAYYGAHGFSTAFFVRAASADRAELAAAAGTEPARLIPVSMQSLCRMRRAHFAPAVLWEQDMLAYAVCEWKYGGGELIAFEGGYSLCHKAGGRVLVKELCVERTDWPRVAALLLARYPADRFEFLLPPDSAFFPNAKKMPYGMLRPCGDAKEACDTSHAYINLLLD